MKAIALVAAFVLAAPAAHAQESARAEAASETEAAAAAEDEDLMPRVATSPDVPAASPGAAADEIVLERTEVTGNRELPRVLYIVPWRKSDPGDLVGRPVKTLLDEVLAPLDREEFIRLVDYYSDLYEEPATSSSEELSSAGARAAGD